MKVVKTTKLCARIITRSSWEVRSKDILANLEWETLENKRYNLKDKFMFKVMNGRAPEYIKDLFRPKEQIIVWFGYLQLIGPQSLGSIVVVSLCVLLLIWV